MAIEYFCCFHSYRKKIAKLSDQEVGRLFRSLLEYSETGETQELAGREAVAFDFISDDIDRAKKAYDEKCETNKSNGLKGGRPKNPKNRTVILETQETQTEDKTKTERKYKEKNEGRVKAAKPPTPARHKYGQYGNVLLTDEELDKLKSEFPDWEARIERLSEYMASKGTSYKNHLATIRAWARKDVQAPTGGENARWAEPKRRKTFSELIAEEEEAGRL